MFCDSIKSCGHDCQKKIKVGPTPGEENSPFMNGVEGSEIGRVHNKRTCIEFPQIQSKVVKMALGCKKYHSSQVSWPEFKKKFYNLNSYPVEATAGSVQEHKMTRTKRSLFPTN